MARVKRGVQARAKHKKIIKLAKGYRGRSKNVFRIAIEKVEKGLDPLGRGQQYTAVPIDDTYPKYIQENQEKYSHLIKAWN